MAGSEMAQKDEDGMGLLQSSQAGLLGEIILKPARQVEGKRESVGKSVSAGDRTQTAFYKVPSAS